MSTDILAAIDQAVGCQHCGGKLDNSPSQDFCSQSCQEHWHAARAEPLRNYTEAGHDFRDDETGGSPIRDLLAAQENERETVRFRQLFTPSVNLDVARFPDGTTVTRATVTHQTHTLTTFTVKDPNGCEVGFISRIGL